MELQAIKLQIWTAAKQNIITVQVAADKAKVRLPLNTVENANKVLKQLTKPRRKSITIPVTHLDRYRQAHEENFKTNYPHAYKDGHYFPPDIPAVATANGLTTFICNYLGWLGYRSTRINVTGRTLPDGTKIPSSTRKGSADISSTIRGKSVMWEVKAGRDTPSDHQIKEQQRERKAGGEYFFTHNVEEFFAQLDIVLSLISGT